MRLKNKKSGFTLLEIIIVIIIVGVLASLALPRLFNTIEYSRSTEALNIMATLKRAADRCAMAAEAVDPGQAVDTYYGLCLTWDELGMPDPTTAAGNNFDWPAGGAAINGNVWSIEATRNNGTGDTITFQYDVANGIFTRSGDGDYSAIK